MITNTNTQSSSGTATTTATTTSTSSKAPTKKLKLYANNEERESYEQLANLFGIIRAVDGLERAFSTNGISPREYKRECTRLIEQFKAAQQITQLDTAEKVHNFMNSNNLSKCKMGFKRLVEGNPGVTYRDSGASAKVVAETVQHFITLMDSLRLNLVAIDDIQPLLSDLVDSVTNSLINFDGKEKIGKWFTTINQMKATEELNEEQKRQLLLDLETSYTSFHKNLDTS